MPLTDRHTRSLAIITSLITGHHHFITAESALGVRLEILLASTSYSRFGD